MCASARAFVIEIGFLLRRKEKNERASQREGEREKEQVGCKNTINDAKDDENWKGKAREREREGGERVEETRQQADLFWAITGSANQSISRAWSIVKTIRTFLLSNVS